MAAIIDVLRGTISTARDAKSLWADVEDSNRLDGLDRKWEHDSPALVEKLRTLTVIQALALIDLAEQYWSDVSSGRLAEVDPREWAEQILS